MKTTADVAVFREIIKTQKANYQSAIDELKADVSIYMREYANDQKTLIKRVNDAANEMAELQSKLDIENAQDRALKWVTTD
jgi:hypothetical protein